MFNLSLIIYVILHFCLSNVTSNVQNESRVECHKLHVLNSDGRCQEEGRFFIRGNCTAYVDCVVEHDGTLQGNEFLCVTGYFNGTACQELTSMVTSCPQTDCFMAMHSPAHAIGNQSEEAKLAFNSELGVFDQEHVANVSEAVNVQTENSTVKMGDNITANADDGHMDTTLRHGDMMVEAHDAKDLTSTTDKNDEETATKTENVHENTTNALVDPHHPEGIDDAELTSAVNGCMQLSNSTMHSMQQTPMPTEATHIHNEAQGNNESNGHSADAQVYSHNETEIFDKLSGPLPPNNREGRLIIKEIPPGNTTHLMELLSSTSPGPSSMGPANTHSHTTENPEAEKVPNSELRSEFKIETTNISSEKMSAGSSSDDKKDHEMPVGDQQSAVQDNSGIAQRGNSLISLFFVSSAIFLL